MQSGPPKQLSASTIGALRTFAYWVANGTVGSDVVEGIDYWQEMREGPSLMEQVFAIFANVLRLDEQGQVLNAKAAERRAAQYLRQYMTGEPADPPFEDWEVELHAPFGAPVDT